MCVCVWRHKLHAWFDEYLASLKFAPLMVWWVFGISEICITKRFGRIHKVDLYERDEPQFGTRIFPKYFLTFQEHSEDSEDVYADEHDDNNNHSSTTGTTARTTCMLSYRSCKPLHVYSSRLVYAFMQSLTCACNHLRVLSIITYTHSNVSTYAGRTSVVYLSFVAVAVWPTSSILWRRAVNM